MKIFNEEMMTSKKKAVTAHAATASKIMTLECSEVG
jgi:hypothetical protein